VFTEKQFLISRTHPCLEGHFPNNPIVPGVVILDEVVAIILRYNKEYKLKKILNVKFLQPLKAEQAVDVEFSEMQIIETGLTKVKFSSSYLGVIISQGEIQLEKLN